VDLQILNLQSTAIVEAQRLAVARSIVRSGDDVVRRGLDERRPWISRARSRRTRGALGRRALLVFEVAAEDEWGRRVTASVAVIAECGCDRRGSRAALVDRARELASSPPDALAKILSRATDEVVSAARAFAAARLRRERAIASNAAAAAARTRDRYQPGLFDRRAERTRQRQLDALAAGEQMAARRVGAATAAAAVRPSPPSLLLVLVP
jgi:hypothetical protein